eukprot:scaffold681230_cov60-Prasinocladus_malaysianus.AAC.1
MAVSSICCTAGCNRKVTCCAGTEQGGQILGRLSNRLQQLQDKQLIRISRRTAFGSHRPADYCLLIILYCALIVHSAS